MICTVCSQSTPTHRMIHVLGQGDLCFACYNEEMARTMGVEFDDARLAPVVMDDVEGESHTFDIVSRLAATGHVMEAIEIRQDEARGYSFAVMGDAEAEALTLFARLYERMREGLATRHTRRGRFGRQLTDAATLTGRIESTPSTDHQIPTLVVDGEELSWNEVGRMLMTYEGFVVEVKIRDYLEIVD